ncbi:MAG: hypothetical protein AB7L13_11495 [Acidimicrobiia bacterium]
MTPEQLVATACPLLADLGGRFYFDGATLARGKEYGLDGMRFYILGRGGVLGDVEPAVVQSAFGYFSAGSIEKLWTTAKEKLAPREAAHVYHECAAAFGRAHFASLDLSAFNAAAAKVVAAAHPAAFALFAGWSAEPLTDDVPGRAMQLAVVLREFRGSAHLVAVLASGVEPEIAHFIRRPEMYKGFGYDDANAPAVTDTHRAALDAAETLTDKLVLPAYSALTASEADALASGAQAMHAALASR